LLLATRRDASLGNEKLFVKCAENLGAAKSDSAAKNEIARKNNTIKGGTVIETAFRGQGGFLFERGCPFI